MNNTLAITLILWILWFGTAVIAAFAVRGWLVERRLGLRISAIRLYASLFVFAAASVLQLIVLLHHEQPVVEIEPSPPEATLPDAARAELSKISTELQQIESRRQELLRRQDELQPSNAAPAPRPRPKFQISHEALIDGAALFEAALLLAGAFFLISGGSLETLLPPGWGMGRDNPEERLAERALLDRLTEAVWKREYEPALSLAGQITESRLEALDWLDVRFLRAYASVQIYTSSPDNSADRARRYLHPAIEDLQKVLEAAPARGEVIYLLAQACGWASRSSEAVKLFRQARGSLKWIKGDSLPIDHNESVGLLEMAEVALSGGQTAEASSLFADVARLGKLGHCVVQSQARIAMIDLRQSVQKQEIPAAAASLEKLAALKGLTAAQLDQIEDVRLALSARIGLREQNPQCALTEADKFLAKHPLELPPVTEEAASGTFSPVLDSDLGSLTRPVYRGFLFIKAVALSTLESKRARAITEREVAVLAEPLLRGLLVDPRQRDLLGALGGLYYWFRKDLRAQAIEWLEAAETMGVGGRIVGRILERDRMVEMNRSEVLDWFRSASSRFLRDPGVAAEVRNALIEELGRFQEFEPLLIELKERPEIESVAPSVEDLRERSLYLARLIRDVSLRGDLAKRSKLSQIETAYRQCLQTLEQSSEQLATLERQVFSEMSDVLAF